MEKFILISLAVWRLSSMLAQEEGPGNIFSNLRKSLASYEHPFWQNVSNGVHCVWCNSIWIALLGALVLSPANFLWGAVDVLALSSVSIIINSFVMKGD